MHKARRARLAADVNAGRMTCARCGQPIEPGQPWALDHRDDRKGYLGPSHQSCNAAAGAQRRHELRRGNGNRFLEKPYRWSQRWSDDPPVGTINLDGGRNPEIYLGNGEWQPVDSPSFL
jgi:hypothetical protein